MQVSKVDPLALTAQPTSEQFAAIETFMNEIEHERGHVIDLSTEHFFADDNRLYGRSVRIPAEHVLLGGAHCNGTLSVSVGDITVLTDDGPRRLTGIHVVPALAGHKRIGVTHAETFWLCVSLNPTQGTDVKAIEDALCAESSRLMTRRDALVLQ